MESAMSAMPSIAEQAEVIAQSRQAPEQKMISLLALDRAVQQATSLADLALRLRDLVH